MWKIDTETETRKSHDIDSIVPIWIGPSENCFIHSNFLKLVCQDDLNEQKTQSNHTEFLNGSFTTSASIFFYMFQDKKEGKLFSV